MQASSSGSLRAGALDRLLRVRQRAALGRERRGGGVVDPLDGDPPVAAAVRAHQVGELGRPALRPVVGAGAGSGERHGDRRADLVDRGQIRREVMAARKLEQDHRPRGRHE
jgi:hypothetical protein